MIPRVVIDTNLYISALFYGGLPARLLLLASDRVILALASESTLNELRRILRARFSSSILDADRVLFEIEELATMVAVSETVRICRDPDDDRILECALAGHADYIITGDKYLLALHPFRGNAILTARDFLERSIA